MTEKSLAGKVAMISGSSRGIGAGIAEALGLHGATVYVTGRTERSGQSEWAGTTEEVAQRVTAAGGKGIAVTCDFGDDEQIRRLFEQIDREQGKLDILVNNATRLHSEVSDPVPFWEQPLKIVDLLDVGCRSFYVTSWYAAPLLLKSGRGLVMNTSTYGAVIHIQNPAYGMGKAAADKLAGDLSVQFRGRNVAAFSFWYGSVATERHNAHVEETQDPRWSDQVCESTQFSGHVLAALYNDPDLFEKSGKTYIVAELAKDYGILDEGGVERPSYREAWCGPWLPHPMPSLG